MPRCIQALTQLFDGLAIQRVQHIRAIERDSCDMILHFVQQIFVSHSFPE